MSVKMIKFLEDKKIVVEVERLKSAYKTGRLKGATVFARLFGIIDDSLFQVDATNIIQLDQYDIRIDHWVSFISYVYNGVLLEHSCKQRKLSELQNVMKLCVVLGGVPHFEKYFTKMVNEINNIYNPMTPEEDVQCKYTWHINTTHGMCLEFDTKIFSLCSPVENSPGVFYVRETKVEA